jgi:hypothetical protein
MGYKRIEILDQNPHYEGRKKIELPDTECMTLERATQRRSASQQLKDRSQITLLAA